MVTLAGYKPGMSDAEQLRLGVTLGHEAYRDGVVDGNNEEETVAAVKGHTEMAMRMIQAGNFDVMDGTLEGDIEAYLDETMDFTEYVKANYDSSADYWRLKTVLDADGNILSYTVDWDDSLDLTIENADGTTSKLEADQIQTESGINSISQWFRENELTFGDDIRQGFVSLGIASEATKALTDAIDNQNSAKNFDAITKRFSGSINALINSGLEIGGLGILPDQSTMYGLMPDSTRITTLYGIRLITPELNGYATGTLYHWAKFNHFAEDIAGGRIVQTPTTTNELVMGWNDLTGFKVTIGFDNGYEFESNHLHSDSSMNLLKSMLLSRSTEKIAAGLQFATVGTTGSASTGPHNHLVGRKSGTLMAPSDIFTAMGIPNDYKKSNTELTGYPVGTAYNDPAVLQDILKYGGEFDRKAYVNAHKDLFKDRFKMTKDGMIVYVFDISTMSYKPHRLGYYI